MVYEWLRTALVAARNVLLGSNLASSRLLSEPRTFLYYASEALFLLDAVRQRAEEHRRTPMIGRTHGVHAEPMTLGVKLALWYAELQRDMDRVLRARETVSVGKISGAVGMFAHLEPVIEARVCARLGLEPAPVSSQVIQRDRHAELLSALAITALPRCSPR